LSSEPKCNTPADLIIGTGCNPYGSRDYPRQTARLEGNSGADGAAEPDQSVEATQRAELTKRRDFQPLRRGSFITWKNCKKPSYLAAHTADTVGITGL
jgi:hypothetical protein